MFLLKDLLDSKYDKCYIYLLSSYMLFISLFFFFSFQENVPGFVDGALLEKQLNPEISNFSSFFYPGEIWILRIVNVVFFLFDFLLLYLVFLKFWGF